MNRLQALYTLWLLRKIDRAQKGQGVIEYAGALVIAAVLVAAVLAIGPNGISTLFTTILTSVQTYLTGQLPK
jgi:hypothetical protein